MPKQKFEVELDVPDGYEIVDYRHAGTGDLYIGVAGAVRWMFFGHSAEKQFILRKVPVYRDPVLPADWGKTARFSHDGKEWVDGRLASYAALNADDKNRWGASGTPFWYKFCQVLDE